MIRTVKQKPSPQKLTRANRSAEKIEWKRLQVLNQHEEAARSEGFSIIAGIDEAGRGPLAGPVVAAACIIPEGVFFLGIDDSKKLLPKVRQKLFEQLVNDQRISFGIGISSHEEIDQINILQATIVAMQRAIANLSITPHLLLVDGRQKLNISIPSKYIIRGDSASQSIAAASIIAKETRDGMMLDYHQKWPEYKFDQHKGYGTALHLEALDKHGPSPIHRRSFAPVLASKESGARSQESEYASRNIYLE